MVSRSKHDIDISVNTLLGIGQKTKVVVSRVKNCMANIPKGIILQAWISSSALQTGS
ncbi:hypothetical protein GCM10027170_20070 [Aliiglaciecola aliphaticivorans]